MSPNVLTDGLYVPSACLPTLRVSLVVKAGNHDNLISWSSKIILWVSGARLNVAGYDDWETQRAFPDCLHRCIDSPPRTAQRARVALGHTRVALFSRLRSPPATRRPAASRLLKQARFDLLPRDHIGRILLVPCNALIELRPLCVRQRHFFHPPPGFPTAVPNRCDAPSADAFAGMIKDRSVRRSVITQEDRHHLLSGWPARLAAICARSHDQEE